uniref:Uncharacterized protein n=1 Tax=viral metagenome TaxID=1070528 RepID=A0A6C0IT79_9ZZZZ
MNIYNYVDQPSSQKFETMNNRAYSRNIPSQPLQPYLEARPVLTKYSIMPVVDPRATIHTPLQQQATYDPDRIFNHGNDTAPWSGYASNVNKESELRNQIYALQSCPQAFYVPSSTSNLYNVSWNNSINNGQQPFPGLFTEEPVQTYRKNNEHTNDIGYALFNNTTRQQLKNLTKM